MNKQIALLLILLNLMALCMVPALSVKAQFASSDVIRIMSDGSVQGTDKIQRNGDVYTLTSNLNSAVGVDEAFIFLEKDGIIFDGSGHTIQGTGHGTAIFMLGQQSVTIKNFNIENFETGINFWAIKNWPSDSKFWGLLPASNNQIFDNNITITGTVFGTSSAEAGWAIYLQEAIGNLISGNNITSQDPRGGIYFGWTTVQNSLFNNKLVNCGLFIKSSNQTTAVGNTADGKPLVFLEGKSNQVIDDAGLIYLFNCKNMTVKDIALSADYGQTIQLSETQNSQVTNCEGYITLINSNNNTTI